MPLYEYRCDACTHLFEVIQKFSDAHIAICPKCGGSVQKLLSSPAIQFKGSGFYLTDYGRGTGKPEGGGKGEKGKTDGGKADGGTSDAGKSDGSKSEGSKSDGGAKADSGSSSSESKGSSSESTSAKPTGSKGE
jgi:putative FmdB family regulatory protein